jgi:hypothetical protein
VFSKAAHVCGELSEGWRPGLCADEPTKGFALDIRKKLVAPRVTIILLGSAALARAQDLSGLDSPAFLLWVWFCRLFLPMASIQGRYDFGFLALAQGPLILLTMARAWVAIRRHVRSVRWRIVVLAFTHVLVTFATNQWTLTHRRDTRGDFPVLRAVSTPPSPR